jgi:hypothetical protein
MLNRRKRPCPFGDSFSRRRRRRWSSQAAACSSTRLGGRTPALPERGDGRRPSGENHRHSCACDHPRGDRHVGSMKTEPDNFGDRSRYSSVSASRAWTNGDRHRGAQHQRQRQSSGREDDPARKREAGRNGRPVFVAFASVALECPDRAADQLEKASTSAICGTLLGGHVTGDELSNPKFDPCWKKGGGAGLPGFCAQAGHSGNEPAAGRQLRGWPMSSATRLRPRSCCGI